ncbi:hypothetical protein P153DRAFT_9465 [Dothidotthia symphoricarpi CBS 119687]|uniref:Uncharacterized protein n=1 Tax=Dothidotthia symphoricarpi CBS 119687 TaxID=1392245 RepID=A0A6A6AVB1_9PLEO|nr:uncharacterized protein P153DRAFT_9465 [Dothidotthia symphoricarpi CBS 119687]KAF2134787.1 hypothetical protein P153DRAFT_9465 [Dothidotthia symphoricarpi CBS 119687]
MSSTRANQWFVPGDGIAREVITADIQRYLGPDALVRPGVGTGEYQNQPGYWITAYRTLTSQMIQDLKLDSQRWQQERTPGEAGRGVAYQDSRTHAARQHWGPTKPYEHPSEPPRQAAAVSSRTPYASSAGSYSGSEANYTHAPSAAYGSSHPGYQPAPAVSAPRTQPADPYAYPQSSGRDSREYQTQPGYSPYSTQAPTDPYGRPTAPPTASYPASSTTPAPGYYIASDGRQYPLSQQPQSSRNPGPGKRNY